MLATITSLYAVLLALMLIYTALRTIKFRRAQQIGLGDGGNPDLQRLMRLQANFVEYVPMALMLLLIAEVNLATAPVLHVAGALLVLGRGLHIWGFGSASGYSHGRFYGTLLTWLVIIGLALSNVLLLARAA